jgi:hypothetical protein
MNRNFATATLCAVLSAALGGCEAKKSSNPLSPSVAGPIAGVDITAPQLLEPAQGVKYKESQQPIKLIIGNATSNGVRPVTYLFEVAADANFNSKVFARGGVPAGDGGRTSVQIDRLDSGRTYYWRAKADDGANASAFASSQFDLLPKPVLNAPGLVSPINNARATSRRPALTVNNSDRNSGVGGVSYEFQVATDQAFTRLVAAGIVDEMPGQTTFTPNGELAFDLTYFWRARASDGDTTSAWAGTQTFRGVASPTPSPSPSPGPAPGGPCVSSNPQAIVECERAKYGHMDSGQLLQFERAVARSLNANGISGGPFGILRKGSGASCGGYSCDIICAGSGTGQRQWDILNDAEGSQGPTWSGPSTYPNIRVDVCEIQ